MEENPEQIEKRKEQEARLEALKAKIEEQLPLVKRKRGRPRKNENVSKLKPEGPFKIIKTRSESPERPGIAKTIINSRQKEDLAEDSLSFQNQVVSFLLMITSLI